ncbi:hypothetical protein THRCLA_07102 [Thraustotheca clavata]|uniref:Secreted protein n=1 Tax=Thraustotheca clavata TaxID=74557 RepID=A0A1V9ZGK9_9STRA|nr:hypothetical protein THRCLA_07102 [Thraustotheca clavata]
MLSIPCVLTLIALTTQAITMYVDPVLGNDVGNDGTLAKPWKTLVKAQSITRQLLATQKTTGVYAPIDVVLRGGSHSIASTLVFGPGDSGYSAVNRVTYRAYCNANLPSDMSILQYPYVMNSSTDPRYLWNGVDNKALWAGPTNPLSQLGVNSTATPTSPPLVLPTVCFDLVGVGHTCYSTEASCVSDCIIACSQNVDKRVYSSAIYDQFYLLFGRDLRNEDECVGLCSQMCTTCEQPIISGMKTITNGAWTPYTPPSWLQPNGTIYQLSLASLGVKSISDLYINGNTLLPRAGFPNSVLVNGTWKSRYSPVVNGTERSLSFNPRTFAANTQRWANYDSISIEVMLVNGSNLWYNVYNVSTSTISLGAGGGQMTPSYFANGAPWSTGNATFRCENDFAELDAPGEWYFDTLTSTLYMIPPVGVTLTSASISFPLVKQLVQVQGTSGTDLSYSIPGYYTILTAALSETAYPQLQPFTSHVTFDGIIFSGTERTEMELYEALPGHPWTQTRHYKLLMNLTILVAAVYIESASDIVIQRSIFTQIGGNALILSGRNENIQIVHNHFQRIGGAAISVLPRGVMPFPNIYQYQFMNTMTSNISYNQIHDYGLVVAQSSALMLLATNLTVVTNNLVYNIPSGGVSYSQSSSNGDQSKPVYLLRPFVTPVSLPVTLATNLSFNYSINVDLGRFDIPMVAKIIGGPICPRSQGRGGALYGQQHSGCFGCCPTTSGTSIIQNPSNPNTSPTVASMSPGNVFQLQVTSAPYFDAPVDVFIGFHIVTPNRLVEVPSWRFRWTVKTRPCSIVSIQQPVSCGGPCGCPLSNVAANMPACVSGPFDSLSTCSTGSLGRVLYYNCTMMCTSTTCT